MAKPKPNEGNPPPPEGEGNPPPKPPEGEGNNGNGNEPTEEDIAAVVRRVLSEELPRILAGDEGNPPPEGEGNNPPPAGAGTARDDEATMYRAVKAAMDRLGKEQQFEGRLAQVEEKVKEEAPVQFRRVTKLMGWTDPEPKAKAAKR